MTILRYRSTWTGFSGAPGLTSLYAFPGATDQEFASAAIGFLADALSIATPGDTLPNDVTISGDSVVDHLDELTGTLEASFPVVPEPPIAGASSGSWAGPAGVALSWLTGAVRRGHRVRGRTFLVPIAATAFDVDGTISSSALTNFRAAATAWAGHAVNPVVWARPTGLPVPSGGAAFAIAASSVADKVAVLRSRRD